jgi:hypothetical protein
MASQASRSLVAISLAFLLAACGQGATDNPATTSVPNLTTTSEPQPDISVGDVTLTRSGGFAGFTTTVTVHSDGAVVVTTDSESPPAGVLAESELNALHRLVASPDFAALEESYVPPDGVCCDLFYYTVTAAVGDTTIESTTADSVETPQILQQVIDLLEGLIS